jgi:hypothetical protein
VNEGTTKHTKDTKKIKKNPHDHPRLVAQFPVIFRVFRVFRGFILIEGLM